MILYGKHLHFISSSHILEWAWKHAIKELLSFFRYFVCTQVDQETECIFLKILHTTIQVTSTCKRTCNKILQNKSTQQKKKEYLRKIYKKIASFLWSHLREKRGSLKGFLKYLYIELSFFGLHTSTCVRSFRTRNYNKWYRHAELRLTLIYFL